MEQDRKTRVALKEAHLENALGALRKAISTTDSDAERTELTEVAQVVAMRKRQAANLFADMREAEARLAHDMLEA